jgi:hypothetical protein
MGYPLHDKAATVTTCGRICFNNQKINLSQVFAGPTYAATGGAGGKPCMTFASGNLLQTAAVGPGAAQGFTLFAVSTRNPTSSSQMGLVTTNASFVGMYYYSAATN